VPEQGLDLGVVGAGLTQSGGVGAAQPVQVGGLADGAHHVGDAVDRQPAR
jgi:hypothetical protein